MLTVDHGFNASTFTARVVTSTGADLGAALVGRRRAPCRARCTAAPPAGRSTCSTRSARPTAPTPGSGPGWTAGEQIMGFGHAVYRTDDPRSVLLREVARGSAAPLVGSRWRSRSGCSRCWPS